MLGYTKQELKQKSLTDITYFEQGKTHSVSWQQLLNGEINNFTIQKRCFTKDNGLIWLKITASLRKKSGPFWEWRRISPHTKQ